MFDKFKRFTLCNEQVFAANIELAARVSDVPGCVVECGVWRGGMVAGIAEVLGNDRRYYLLDSFKGLQPAKEIDGPAALEYQRNTGSPGYFENCSSPLAIAEHVMRDVAGITNYEILAGWFDDTLPRFRPGPIALLRLDADWHEATRACLYHLFDMVTPGGIVIVDDYFVWDGCAIAVHEFLARRMATERLQSLGPVCFMVKK